MSPLQLSVRFLQTQPDSRLVALSRAGHERAFEALVRRYRKQLLGYCRRVGSPKANAEDALQQTFLQAWVAVTAGREVRDARAWLFRIAHNVVVSNSRQQVGTETRLTALPVAQSADAEAEQRLAVREVLAGVASLPELQRDAMVGTAVDGLSHAEIARELGLTSGAVRGLIYRARSTLRVAAAVFVPAPLVHWAARHAGASGVLYEAVAGGGSAGLGGLLLKSGVITAAAGVLVTAAGVTTRREAHNQQATAIRVVTTSGGRAGHVSLAARTATGAVEVARLSVVRRVSADSARRPSALPIGRGAARSAPVQFSATGRHEHSPDPWSKGWARSRGGDTRTGGPEPSAIRSGSDSGRGRDAGWGSNPGGDRASHTGHVQLARYSVQSRG